MPKRTKEVLRYFLEHPQVVESVEGLARWRLRDEVIRRTVDEISEALGWLVAEGFLREESARTADAIFSLNQERTAQARQLVGKG